MAARDRDHDREHEGTEPIPQGGVTRKEDAPEARLERERVIPELTHDDFMNEPLDRLARRVGLEPPEDDSEEAEREWREQAWRSHKQDLANRDEWGTATQVTEPPEGEDPNL